MNTEIGIELYRGGSDVRQGLQLDLGCIVQRLYESFPGIEFEEEYFQRTIEFMRGLTALESQKPALDIAVRDAEERGPGFRFRVSAPSGSPLKGGFSRYCLSFRFDSAVHPELKARAEQLLASFTLNRFQNETSDDGTKK